MSLLRGQMTTEKKQNYSKVELGSPMGDNPDSFTSQRIFSSCLPLDSYCDDCLALLGVTPCETFTGHRDHNSVGITFRHWHHELTA